MMGVSDDSLVLAMHKGGYTLDYIGKQFGVSRQRIHQIVKKAGYSKSDLRRVHPCTVCKGTGINPDVISLNTGYDTANSKELPDISGT